MSDRFIVTARLLLALALMLCGSTAFATVSNPTFLPVTAVEGQPYTGQVATFVDDSGSALTATITLTYGPVSGPPGTPTTITGSSGSFGLTVSATAAANTYLLSVSGIAPFNFTGLGKFTLTINDAVGTGNHTGTGTTPSPYFTVVPLLVTGNTSTTGTTTIPAGSTIAAYSDFVIPDIGTITATVNWGDGTPLDTTPIISAGTNVPGPPAHNDFIITSNVSHTYTNLGAYNIVTTITDSGAVGGSGSVINTVNYVAAVGTTLSLTSSSPLVGSNPTSTFGDLVTFTASVVASDGSALTGQVNFFDNASPLGSATVATVTTMVGPTTTYTNSTAFAINSLTAGSHVITATYAGDLTHITSNTTLLNGQTVNTAAISLIHLGSSINPVLTALPVTFTATVISGNSSTPNGMVTFYDTDTLLAVVPAVGSGSTSTAQYSSSVLSAGLHVIRATYTGDTNGPALASSATYSSIDELVTSGSSVPSSGSSSKCGHGFGVGMLSLGLLLILRNTSSRRRLGDS